MALAAAVTVALPGVLLAQSLPPDVGLLGQQPAPMPQPQRPRSLSQPSDPRVDAKGPTTAERRVAVDRVVVEGCTVVPDDLWSARFASLPDAGVTLTDMRAWAEQVQLTVQQSGRPYAVAYLPPQDLSAGTLVIRVIEGRYGQVTSQGALASEAAGWLAPLKSGTAIGPELERQMLLLSELPGVNAVATLSPGRTVGDADIHVDVQPGRSWGGEVRVDNHGNRYAGRHRVVGTIFLDRLVTLGDRLTVAAGTGDQGGGQGLLSYALPVGSQGVRLEVAGGFSRYELGKEFDILGASGKVVTTSAALTVPLAVTQQRRVLWQTGLQHQRISNQQTLFDTHDHRTATAWTNALQATQWLARGGALWGRVSAETGRVRIGDELSRDIDQVTARTSGSYLLLGAEASLLQPVGAWAVYGHVAGQVANRNLDPSKKWVLGGPNGVRAWPVSEGSGDDGALAQIEVRRQMGAYQPFLFADTGRVQINHQPWDDGRRTRTLSGAGLGLRMSQGPWQVQSTAGWRLGPHRHSPVSDPSAAGVQFWLSVGYQL